MVYRKRSAPYKRAYQRRRPFYKKNTYRKNTFRKNTKRFFKSKAGRYTRDGLLGTAALASLLLAPEAAPTEEQFLLNVTV